MALVETTELAPSDLVTAQRRSLEIVSSPETITKINRQLNEFGQQVTQQIPQVTAYINQGPPFCWLEHAAANPNSIIIAKLVEYYSQQTSDFEETLAKDESWKTWPCVTCLTNHQETIQPGQESDWLYQCDTNCIAIDELPDFEPRSLSPRAVKANFLDADITFITKAPLTQGRLNIIWQLALNKKLTPIYHSFTKVITDPNYFPLDIWVVTEEKFLTALSKMQQRTEWWNQKLQPDHVFRWGTPGIVSLPDVPFAADALMQYATPQGDSLITAAYLNAMRQVAQKDDFLSTLTALLKGNFSGEIDTFWNNQHPIWRPSLGKLCLEEDQLHPLIQARLKNFSS